MKQKKENPIVAEYAMDSGGVSTGKLANRNSQIKSEKLGECIEFSYSSCLQIQIS